MNPDELDLWHRRHEEVVREAETDASPEGCVRSARGGPPRRPGAGDVWLGSTRRSHCEEGPTSRSSGLREHA